MAGWLVRGSPATPGEIGLLLTVALAVALPVGYYLASPIWIRTELIEPEPAAEVVSTRSPAPSAPTAIVEPSPSRAEPELTEAPQASDAQPTPFLARTIATGTFHGTDDFHFGRGPPDRRNGSWHYVLRFDDFSVRNGPDLYVYLSPDRAGYGRAHSSWEAQGDRRRLRLRAPGRHGSGRFRERDHLVQAVLAPLRGRAARRRVRSRYTRNRVLATVGGARTIPPETPRKGRG